MPLKSLAAPPLLPLLRPFTCRLPTRSLLRVAGRDAHEFLQGLYTNDAKLLTPGGSQWGCFLYYYGRVMCDAYVYQASQVYEGQSSLLIDVHHAMREPLLDHLVEMKMRKKVKIEDVSDSLVVAACLGQEAPSEPQSSAASGGASSPTLSDSLAETFLDPRTFALFPSPPEDGATIAPRWVLRKKIVPAAWAPPVQPVFTQPAAVTGASVETNEEHTRAAADAFSEFPYATLLIASGVAEGPELFKNDKSLPFELNTDFLGGVHFNKGCYIGQELTHRTHVMLVTRKRTVPLYFPAVDCGDSREYVGQGLYVDGGKEKVGEVTASVGPFGLGLVRLRYVDTETRSIPDLTVKDGRPVFMSIPSWWPPKQVKKILKRGGDQR